MPRRSIPAILVLSILSFTAACQRTPSDGPEAVAGPVTVFSGVNVVPMDTERVLEEQSVIVRGGVITEVGPAAALEIPQEAQVIDGNGSYLMPGLVDAHIHLRSTDELLSYLAHGVTTVVHLSGAQHGAPDLLRYRAQLASGGILGPSLYTSGPMLDGDPPIWRSVSRVVATPEEARAAVLEQQQQGYDLIKVYNNLAPDALEAVVRTAHAQGMAVVGHIPRVAGRGQALQRALEAGLDVVAHGEEYFFTYFYGAVDSLLDRGEAPYPDEAGIPEAVRMTQAAGAAVTPNLSFVAMTRRQLDDMEAVLADPEVQYLHPDVRVIWEEQNPTLRDDRGRFDLREQAKYPFLQGLTKALNDAGVPLLLGTDASISGLFPGKSAHVELAELVKAGLTPYDALAAGTRNPGAFLHEHGAGDVPFGVIAPGQRADLILVRGNPLDDVGNASRIEGVMVRGRWVPQDELEARRAEISASYQQ